MHAGAIEVDGFGEQLVAIAAQGIEIDFAGLHWPEASIAGFVPEIARLVGRADERALPRLVHFVTSPWWSVAFDLAHEECFEVIDRGPRICAELGDLDQPFSA